MRKKDIPHGILIEFSDYGAEKARERKKAFKAEGKELSVLQAWFIRIAPGVETVTG
jgi:hypothetical protein